MCKKDDRQKNRFLIGSKGVGLPSNPQEKP